MAAKARRKPARKSRSTSKPKAKRPKKAPRGHFHGLRTAVYFVSDVGAAKNWYAGVLGVNPYFDEPFYVGFSVGGFELGLHPRDEKFPGGSDGVGVYWGVSNADEALARLLSLGASPHNAVEDVGGGIRIGSVKDPFGNILGIIENPHFKLK